MPELNPELEPQEDYFKEEKEEIIEAIRDKEADERMALADGQLRSFERVKEFLDKTESNKELIKEENELNLMLGYMMFHNDEKLDDYADFFKESLKNKHDIGLVNQMLDKGIGELSQKQLEEKAREFLKLSEGAKLSQEAA